METKIPTEILIKILTNVQSFRPEDLYSSLLVNRNWCKVAIPILWELPLGQEFCNGLRKKALCIRTYISCMDIQARTLLTQNGFDLSSSPPQTTFDYPSFTHKFIIGNLFYFISIYSQQIIGSNQDNDNNNNNESRILLLLEILKLIINRCSFLDYFKLGEVDVDFFKSLMNSKLIYLMLKLPSAPKVFKKLKTFVSVINGELFKPLFVLLVLNCNDVLNMDLKIDSYNEVQFLVKFISVQNRLENLSIVANYYLDCDLLLWAIISQKETLKSLRLKCVSFNHFEGKLSEIGQFISLRELYMENCYGLHKSNGLFFASSFAQLSSFQFKHTSYNGYPQKFIIKILTVNTNLKNICLELYSPITFDTFSAILNYCTKITKLTLLNLSPEQVIAIFNNNFNELRRFSFDCGEGIKANELLCQMAENVPESLETIEIRMGIFDANSLRKFFEGWCCKEGGRNKKIIVKRTELARLFTLRDEHFKVIEEYQVQFKMEE